MLLVGKPEGRRSLRRQNSCLDNIKMDLGEIIWCDVDWISLIQDDDNWRDLVNVVIGLRIL
jgi:hypothetical protein